MEFLHDPMFRDVFYKNKDKQPYLCDIGITGAWDKTSITGGYSHSLALKNDGTVLAWGANYYGQVVDSKINYIVYPQYVFGTPNDNAFISVFANVTSENKLSLIIRGNNIQNLRDRTFTVKYDTNQIDSVIDLCGYTYKNDLVIGEAEGTDIIILEYSPGIIRFMVNKDIPAGRSWSGIINTIVLKPAVSGQIEFKYLIE